MNKKEIKDYLKRVDELETKLTGEDKETFVWLIYGYNQCAKLLNETKPLQQENQSLKKQLEEYKKWYQDELEENSKLSELWCDSRAKIRKFETQQKEFIKWLEDYLNLFDYRDIQEQAGYDMLEEILQKYRSIIGE